MLAAVVHGHSLRLCNKPLPQLRPGWALVRVRLAGICNTDLEILRGYHNFRGILGHEFVGELVRCGAPRGGSGQEAQRWIGRRVVGEINITCRGMGFARLCATCRRGHTTHCEKRRVLGIVGHDGAFAEYLALPLVNLHRVPDAVPDEMAVFTEPLAAACEILEQVDARKHAQAAVLGDGKLGQLIARVLAAAGLRVVIYGRHPSKLALARDAGIATELAPRGRGADAKSRTYSLVVEATGASDGLARAIAMTAPRGTLVLKSTFHGAAHFETWPLVVKEITVVGSRCGPFTAALKLLSSGRVDPRPLISRVFPLRDAPAAIREAQAKGVLKVLLKS
jgi:alcohol dehydrogenase